MQICSNQGLRWCGLILSLFGTALANFDMSFTVYSVALKDTFNYTQTEVELVASLGTLGVGLGFVEIFLTSWLGYKGSYLVLWLGSPLCCLLLYTAVLYKHIFSSWVVFVGMAQLLTNVMNNSFLLLAMSIAVQNCPERHLGKIIGLYLAASSTGKLFYIGLYQLYFPHDLGGYFLAIALVWAVVYGLCFVLHTPISDDTEKKPTQEPKQAASENPSRKFSFSGSDNIENDRSLKDSSASNILKSSYFHLMFWSSALFHACVITCLNNLHSLAHSIKMQEPYGLLYSVSISICLTRLSFGAIFDSFSNGRYGFVLLFVCYGLFLATMALCLISMTHVTIYLVSLFLGVGIGASNSISLSMLVREYGRRHYRVISGSYYLVFTGFTVCLQTFLGLVYDSHSNSTDIFCYGVECYLWSFVLFCVITILVICAQMLNMLLCLLST